MAKKPRTEKQLANDQRLREMAKAKKKPVVEEEEFEPTEVKEAQAAQATFEPPVTDEIVDEPVPEGGSPVLEAPTQFTNEQLMSMMLSMQQSIIALQQGNPAALTASPNDKIAEIGRGLNKAYITENGVQGILVKYPVEHSHYPDPTKRLFDEPSLKRFALAENYIFKWEVDGVTYEKDRVKYSEPRFTLSLFRRLYDENNEPTGKAALVARQMQHEDEVTAQIAAQRMGILDQFESVDQLLDEIRYLRLRQWLFDIFTPPKVVQFKNKSTTQVINGKAVEVFDTEAITDHDSGVEKAESLATQSGVGSVKTPRL